MIVNQRATFRGCLLSLRGVSFATEESNNPLRAGCYIQAKPICVGAELCIAVLFSQGKALWLIKLMACHQLL
jgi:hypothetical protein